MPDWLSQIRNLFPHMPNSQFVFFIVVVGFIVLMCVLVFLAILWESVRLICGSRGRHYSLDNRADNSVWPHNMGNPMNPNSPLNPNNPMNPNSPMNPQRRWGHSMGNPRNPNSLLNPNNPMNPNNLNNPLNRMHKSMHRSMHRSMHKPMHKPMHKR